MTTSTVNIPISPQSYCDSLLIVKILFSNYIFGDVKEQFIQMKKRVRSNSADILAGSVRFDERLSAFDKIKLLIHSSRSIITNLKREIS